MWSYDYLRKRKVWNENTPVSSNMTISTASGQKPLIGLGYRVSMWLVCYCDVSLVFWSICTDLEEDQEPPVLPQRFCYLTLPAWKCICSSSPKSDSIRQAKQTNIQYYCTVTVPLFTSHQGFFYVILIPNNLRFRYTKDSKCFIQHPHICLYSNKSILQYSIVQKEILN